MFSSGGGGDGVARRYASLADDGALPAPRREAAALLAAAEEHLDGDEDHAEALMLLRQAVDLFRESGDARGAADALHLTVNAHRARAQVTYTKAEKLSNPAALEEASSLAAAELEAFRAAGDRYGEACMLCSLVEVAVERSTAQLGGAELREDVIEHATLARRLFAELGEARMESQACAALASAQLRRKAWRPAQAAAREALRLAQAGAGKKAQARAFHALAISLAQAPSTNSSRETLEEGLGHAMSALAIFRELGLRKYQASELYFVATWMLMLGRPRESLPLAKEAMTTFKELRYGKGWQAESRTAVIRVLMELCRWREARKVAWEGIRHFRDGGEQRCLVLSLDSLVHIHLEAALTNQGDLDEAARAATEGRDLCRELGDRKWEANQLFNLAQVEIRRKGWTPAEEYLMEATAIDEEIGEDTERALKLTLFVDVCFETGRGERALKVAQEIREIYHRKVAKSEEAHSCLIISRCYAMLKEPEKALAAAMECQAMSQEQGDNKGEAAAWEFVSQLNRAFGQATQAEEAMRRAGGLQQQVGDKKAQAYALQHTASILAAGDNFEESVKAAFEALALARASGDDQAEVEMLMLVSQANLGLMMQRDKRAEASGEASEEAALMIGRIEGKALRPAREAAVVARKLGDRYLQGGCMYAIAQVHLFMGRSDAGINAGREAQSLWEAADNIAGSAYAILLVAEGRFQRSDQQGAEAEVNEALRIFQQHGEKAGEEAAYLTLNRIKQGLPKQPGSRGAPAPSGIMDEAFSSAAEEAVTTFKGMDVEDARRIARDVAFQAIGAEDDIDLDSPLMDIGLDSLAAIAFREQLIATSGITVPTSLVFDYPSIAAIADHMVEESQMHPAKR